ncbi:MAG: ATP-binding protein [Sulfuricellaceae bacterium]
MKLKTKLTILLVLSLILGTGLALLFQTYFVRQYVSQVLVKQQFSEARHIAAQLDDELRARVEWIELIVGRITPKVMATRASLTQYLKDRQIAAKYFHGGIYVTSADGVCMADYPEIPGRVGTNYADRSFIQTAIREKRSVVGGAVMGRILKQPVIPIATPILGSDGSVAGVFVGVMTYEQLNFLGTQRATDKEGLQAQVIVYSPKDNMTVFSDNPADVLKTIQENRFDATIMAPLLHGRDGEFVGQGKDGQEITAAITTVPSSGWVLALVSSMRKIHQGIDEINLKIYAAALALSLLLSYLLWRVLARMLAGLGDAALEISLMMQGKRRMHAIPYQGHDEVGELVASFNALQERVSKSEAELRNLTRELEIRVHEELGKNREKDHLLIQQSRLAAMGEMIHNIAHQWRQPLTALGILLANIEDDSKFQELTPETLSEQVKTAFTIIDRMSSTIDDFRNFFRPSREKAPFTLQNSLGLAVAMISASLKHEEITLVLPSADIVLVDGYDNEFAQVLVNIITNARDAIIERGIPNGKIEITIGQENGQAWLSIADNGGGIADSALPKIFDPYFTTKEKGSGIGLYMSRMIMENMGGSIEAHDKEQGAEFVLRLPLAS